MSFHTKIHGQSLLFDDFSNSSVNLNFWTVTLPENDSRVTESGGFVSLENAGRLTSNLLLTNSYSLSGMFCFFDVCNG